MLRTRLALVLPLLAASPAAGEEVMNASAAREFIAGRMFHYTCFDGTNGSGRIFADGSGVGTMRVFGRGERRYLRLPPRTLYIKDEKVCASVRGLYFTPCFNITKTSETSFRGAISGLSFMYCEFNRGGRTQIARKRGARTATRGVLAGAARARP
jgi:hypothetical protein